ncbi:hypothetical protein HMPREF1199_02304 [Hoylesella oralis CC98A]|nr:hypothetical protein HMPREF1199_02304 [Hoylesella oralis CC98A]
MTGKIYIFVFLVIQIMSCYIIGISYNSYLTLLGNRKQ